MWQWIETQLKQSDDFDYLLVAGHYQIVDAYGYYDIALRTHLLPLLKKYKAQAYIQGHRHTLEHAQGKYYFVIDIKYLQLIQLRDKFSSTRQIKIAETADFYTAEVI